MDTHNISSPGKWFVIGQALVLAAACYSVYRRQSCSHMLDKGEARLEQVQQTIDALGSETVYFPKPAQSLCGDLVRRRTKTVRSTEELRDSYCRSYRWLNNVLLSADRIPGFSMNSLF